MGQIKKRLSISKDRYRLDGAVKKEEKACVIRNLSILRHVDNTRRVMMGGSKLATEEIRIQNWGESPKSSNITSDGIVTAALLSIPSHSLATI